MEDLLSNNETKKKESIDISLNQSACSIYNILKKHKVLKRKSREIITMKYSNDEYKNQELEQLRIYTRKLRTKVIDEKKQIDYLIKLLEMSFSKGNNDTTMLSMLYASKLGIDIISAIVLAKIEYLPELLKLLEKVLTQKNNAKYLTRNSQMFPFFVRYIISSKLQEHAHKICQAILMTRSTMYPLKNDIKLLQDIYSIHTTKKYKLDHLCKLLVILIYDHNQNEFYQCFHNRVISKLKPINYTTAENHIITLNLQSFLRNVVKKLFSRFELTKSCVNSNNNNVSELMHLITRPSDVQDLKSDDNKFRDFICKYNNYYQETKYTKFDLLQEEFQTVIKINIFEGFNPSFKKKYEEKDNVYNTYMKLTKLLRSIKSKNKITNVQPNTRYYINYSKYATYQIEMLFVLCTLLSGRRKMETQDKLSRVNIVELLDGYLEYLEWGNIFSGEQRSSFLDQRMNINDDTAYHGEGCCCDKDSSLKVQYLRLIYTFCNREYDNVNNKLKLLSKIDIDHISDGGYMDMVKMYISDKFNMYSDKLFKEKNPFCYNHQGIELYKKLGIGKFDKEEEKKLEDLSKKDKVVKNKKKSINSVFYSEENINHDRVEIKMNSNNTKIVIEKISNIKKEEDIKVVVNSDIKKEQEKNEEEKDKKENINIITENKIEVNENNENKIELKENKIEKKTDNIINTISTLSNPLPEQEKCNYNPEYFNISMEESILKLSSLDNIQSNILKYNQFPLPEDNPVPPPKGKNPPISPSFGLLHKLIYKYMQECYYSSTKYWLSSCIEIMVRGNNPFFQLFVTSTGMIQVLLYDLIYGRDEQKQIIQLSYDLLGELIKFNRANFYLLDYNLSDKREFNDFCKKTTSPEYLVDSNVFLRSIIISNYYFNKYDQKIGIKPEEFFTYKCGICKYVNDNLSDIFINLISVIKPANVCQSNISSINTAILLVIIEYLCGRLYTFISKLFKKDDQNIISVLKNFKVILKLWKGFYNYSPKDYQTLQFSTTINFNTWKKVVDLLLEDNEENPLSKVTEG